MTSYLRLNAALRLLLLATISALCMPLAAARVKSDAPRLFERALGTGESVSAARADSKQGVWPASTRVSSPVCDKTSPLGDTVPIVDAPRRIAGYFLLDRTKEARMFYFLFRSRARDTDPLVLWMTGGPGCSSELAVFYENGPYTINDNLTLSETAFGWDKYHNLIFVDQPINTGFSFSNDDADRVYNEEVVADDMLDFLQEFFAVHPDLAARDLYITGESYAGHYVPAVSHRLWLENRNATADKRFNLKGIAIGNGLTNPEIQYAAYADFALENKLVDELTHSSIQWWFPICRYTIRLCNSYKWGALCRLSLYICQMSVFAPIMAENPDMNVYDITKKCENPLCYDFSTAEAFLNNAAIQASLGVSHRNWQTCDMDVNSDMQGDFMRSYHDLLPEMLADGVRVMIYAGELDFICNWVGNARWVAALQWSGQQAWALAQDQPWISSRGRPAGTVREVGPLSFVKVFKAGHMVPMDQPEHGLQMITMFTRNVSLADVSKSSGVASGSAAVAADAGGKANVRLVNVGLSDRVKRGSAAVTR